MREDIETRLRDMARAVAADTTPRAAHEIRARGDRRRRRAGLYAALPAALLAAGVAGAVAVASSQPSRVPAPITSRSPGPPRPSPTASTPAAQGGGAPALYGISCVGAADCWAVGRVYRPGGEEPLVEHWNGRAWTAGPGSSMAAPVNHVACVSASDCWAIGQSDAEHWDGKAWSAAKIVLPSANDQLFGPVSCPDSTNCWAVGVGEWGQGTNGGRLGPLAAHWDGHRWSAMPLPGTTGVSKLVSVSCASPRDCWAVGSWSGKHALTGGTLTEHWDGVSWTIVRTPSSTSRGELIDVSCSPDGACLAVGVGALVQRWTGGAWVAATAPLPARAKGSELDGVACRSAHWCMAVGDYSTPAHAIRTLAEIWDGRGWSVVASPTPTGRRVEGLTTVSCTSRTNCWAFGMKGIRSFTERWDGATWSIAG